MCVCDRYTQWTLAVKCKRMNYGCAVATTWWSLEPLWLDVVTTDVVYETPALPSSGMCWPKILFTIRVNRLLLTLVSIQTLQYRPWPIRPEGPALYKNKQTKKIAPTLTLCKNLNLASFPCLPRFSSSVCIIHGGGRARKISYGGSLSSTMYLAARSLFCWMQKEFQMVASHIPLLP